MATKQKQATPSANGNGQPQDTLAEAITYEQAIADEAAAIRGDETDLSAALFVKLLPLLRRPIPSGFITTTPATKGKPYESTGIRSLQVQIDRLDNVLTPLNWGWETEWSEEGRLARVRAWVGTSPSDFLIAREAHGGVNQASTTGNLYKGSETNAAKLAFARLGVGHEVYLGAADFDPDVDPDAASEQAKAPAEQGPRKLPPEKAESLRAVITEAGLDPFLEMKLRSFGVAAVTDLTVDQGIELWSWVQEERANG